MTRTELLQRLDVQQPVSAETCFVLLWTYLNQARVAAGENHSRALGIHPFRIEPHLPAGPSLRECLAEAVREIRSEEGDAFDLHALRWLKALDLLFDQRKRVGKSWITGLDGKEYRIRRRNHFLADSFGARVTSEEDQSGTKDLYAHFHVAVPKSVEGIAIEIRTEEEWAESFLRRRLTLEVPQLQVMLWPLETILDYPALDEGGPPSDFISLDEIRNEDALTTEVRKALATARARRVSLLIFPELSIPARVQEEIRSTLKGHGRDGHPILTLFGCCHRKLSGGGEINEAVLLGPDGATLHAHAKLAAFTSIGGKDRTFRGEQLRVGTRVSVLEGPLGNLMPLICLDFIHPPLRQVLVRSHANLFAVPSLSPTTSAHQEAAMALQADNLASSFVSNRTLKGLTEKGTSFFRVPCRKGCQTHLPEPREASFLLFSLEDFLDKAGK